MKALINKMLVLAIASVGLMLATAPFAYAQISSHLEEKAIPVGEFSSIDVSDDFEVTLTKGHCGAKVSVDKLLAPYVQVYVRGKVLYILFDSKAVPKDVKKVYKGREASKPVFRANVSVGELSSLSLRNNAVLNCMDELGSRLSTDIDLADKAQIKNLSINSNAVSVSLKKSSQAALTIKSVSKVNLRTEGNSNLKASVDAHDLITSASGSSEMTVESVAENATLSSSGNSNAKISYKGSKAIVNISGTSDMELTGKGENLTVTGDKNSSLEAGGFDTVDADINIVGPVKVNITVQKNLNANLAGGSALYYSGTPTFTIGRILKSTLAPYGTNTK